MPVAETYAESIGREFSDATSSDWSIFTSSDDASFTTESTRDSFSTVDYGDSCNMDPISSIFNYTPENSRSSVCHRKFLHSRPLTRFVPGNGGHVSNTGSPSHHPERELIRMNQSRKVSHSTEPPSNGNCGMYVYYGSNPIARTSSQFEL